MKLKELLAKRAGLKDKIEVLANKESELPEGENLSAEDVASFDSLEAEFKTLSSKIERAQIAQNVAAQHATPVASTNAAIYAGNGDTKAYEPGEKVAMVAMAVAATNGSSVSVPEYIESNFQDANMAASLDTKTPSAAGYLVQEQHSNDFIEMLKPRTVVESMGARHVPMPSGNLTMTRKTGRGNAGYGAEGTDIKTSKPSVGQSKLTAKKLTALTPISNDLIRQSSRGAIQLVRDDLLETVGLTKDLALLRSDGTGDSPTGILHQTIADNKVDASALTNAPSLDDVEMILSGLVLNLRLSDVPMLDCGWVLSPSVYTYLERLRDGNGNKVYPELAMGMLKNYKIQFSNQVPENTGAGGNESEIYFVDFSQVIIADTYNVNIAVSTEAAYMDGEELVSAFSRDQTILRIITEHDMLLRHTTAASIATGVKWGIAE